MVRFRLAVGSRKTIQSRSEMIAFMTLRLKRWGTKEQAFPEMNSEATEINPDAPHRSHFEWTIS
jgi:hypothetical protein